MVMCPIVDSLLPGINTTLGVPVSCIYVVVSKRLKVDNLLPPGYGSNMTPETKRDPRPLTTAEVGEALGYTRRHVARLAAEGTLEAMRLPSAGGLGRWLFDPVAVEDYRQRRAERRGAA